MFCFGGGVLTWSVAIVCHSRQCQPPRLHPLAGPTVPASVRRAATSGRGRSHALRSYFSAGGASMLVGVCSLACATHVHDGWWCTGISLWPPNGGAESFAPSRRGR
ncbi:hypothetical protein NDU88_005924 [Pleurodeles waltl]|uniref:Uncharacterized protein n=1 Tax=Pleurodeles waltl TaxID=8319 RepID=A0AAV7PK93_PLEWA|nr:hypothetical protein NDU88_005924 [Pleurodeles waltl]